MSDTSTSDSTQLDRIEQLLREGNALRSEAIALQNEAVAMQKSLIEEQRANLAKAGQVNDQALEMQKRGKQVTIVILVVIAGLIGYLSYLLFAKPFA